MTRRVIRAMWMLAALCLAACSRPIAATTPNVAFVSSDGLRDRGDSLHFDAASARALGERYATAFVALTHR